MSEASGSEVTRLLIAAGTGKTGAIDRLWSYIYPELRRLAQAQLARERGGCQLQTTSLVHEAYLRLVGTEPIEWANRRHFFAAAAQAMRRIRVDDARRRGRLKRTPERRRVDLNEAEVGSADDAGDVLAVDEALQQLERVAPPSGGGRHAALLCGVERR